MDLSAIGSRSKNRKRKEKITKDELAELADLSCIHISVIERGV